MVTPATENVALIVPDVEAGSCHWVRSNRWQVALWLRCVERIRVIILRQGHDVINGDFSTTLVMHFARNLRTGHEVIVRTAVKRS